MNVNIEIRGSKKSCMDIYVNGEHYHKIIKLKDRLKAYSNAISKFSNDIDNSYKEVDNRFLLFTGEEVRFDALCQNREPSIIAYYYIMELIKTMSVDGDCLVIIRNPDIRIWFIDYLKEENINVKLSLAFNVLIYTFSMLKWLKRAVRFSLWFSFNPFARIKRKDLFDGFILIDIPKKKSKHRYGVLLDELENNNKIAYTCLGGGFIYHNNNKYIKYVELISIRAIFKVMKEALFFYFNKPKKNNKNIFIKRLGFISFISILRSLIIYEFHFYYIKRKNIKFVLTQSSFNNSFKKPLLMSAIDAQVKIINFLPRPISVFRPAEIIIDAEKNNKNYNPLAGINVVPEVNSLKIMINSKIEPGSVFLKDVVSASHEVTSFSKKTVTVLLSNVKEINVEIINSLSFLKNIKNQDYNLVVRSHPLLELDGDTVQSIEQIKSDWLDGQKVGWKGTNSVVITVSSTAAVEASIAGSGVIWCPFIDDEALLVYPFMQHVGYISNSVEDMALFTISLFDEDKLLLFSNKCHEDSFNKYIKRDADFNIFSLETMCLLSSDDLSVNR